MLKYIQIYRCASFQWLPRHQFYAILSGFIGRFLHPMHTLSFNDCNCHLSLAKLFIRCLWKPPEKRPPEEKSCQNIWRGAQFSINDPCCNNCHLSYGRPRHKLFDLTPFANLAFLQSCQPKRKYELSPQEKTAPQNWLGISNIFQFVFLISVRDGNAVYSCNINNGANLWNHICGILSGQKSWKHDIGRSTVWWFPEVARCVLVKKGVNSRALAPNNPLLWGWVLIGKRMRRIRVPAICF